jgi:hypothetical protein
MYPFFAVARKSQGNRLGIDLHTICLTYINDRFTSTYESAFFWPYRNQLSDDIRLTTLDATLQQIHPRRDPLTLHPLRPPGLDVLVAMHVPQRSGFAARSAPARLGSGSVALPLVCVDRTTVLCAVPAPILGWLATRSAPTFCPQSRPIPLLWGHGQITSG